MVRSNKFGKDFEFPMPTYAYNDKKFMNMFDLTIYEIETLY